MPLFLIALAWVADLKVNPLEKENPEAYRDSEEKQILFQTIQIESNEKRAALQTRMIALEGLRRRNNALRRGKIPGSFRWFWEKALDASEVIAGVSAQLKPLYSAQVEEMKRELEVLRKEKQEYRSHLERTYETQMIRFQQSFQSFMDHTLAEIRTDMSEQTEHYRQALGQQYDQDITAFTGTITNRLETALSEVKMTIREDVSALKETYHEALAAAQKSAKSSSVIKMTPELEMVVNRYPIVSSWLSRPERSVTLQDIISGTGHTPHLIHRRAKEGAFRRTRREGYYRLDSVITWLQTAPLPSRQEDGKETGKEETISPKQETNQHSNTDEIGIISPANATAYGSDIKAPSEKKVPLEDNASSQKDRDKLTITLEALRKNPGTTDEELMVMLGLKRPGSARFWKVKAQSYFQQSA
jgi:hypothetical protein